MHLPPCLSSHSGILQGVLWRGRTLLWGAAWDPRNFNKYDAARNFNRSDAGARIHILRRLSTYLSLWQCHNFVLSRAHRLLAMLSSIFLGVADNEQVATQR
eukprot:TRINITY_DN2268_c0_g1_i1.p2 TRINITY_DN2268_c0_g1~~TRINITY_DN2268_c0_g1_i1.p2  ORF type:complete len:101 (+),score=4.21 TRINITY_DN2268_c0_g1_i1:697-999(+)